MNSLSLRGDTLRLVPTTLTLARQEAGSPQTLADVLGAHLPADWPPPLTDDTIERTALELADVGRFPWSKWYILTEEPAPTLIGIIGLVDRPREGAVELGYSLVASQHRRGLGTRAVALLLDWLQTTGWVDRVVAHTLPGLTPSIRVLEKNGFRFVGPGAEPGTLRYERSFSADTPSRWPGE